MDNLCNVYRLMLTFFGSLKKGTNGALTDMAVNIGTFHDTRVSFVPV